MRKEDYVVVGYISKSHHLQGEVIVTSTNDLLEKYAREPVFIFLDERPVPFFIAPDGLSVRNHNSYIVKFDFIDSLKEADTIIGKEVLLEKEKLGKKDTLPQERSVFNTIGFSVQDQKTAQIGEVIDISNYSGNIILTLNIFEKEILLPFAERYVLRIDFDHQRIEVIIPQELIDLY